MMPLRELTSGWRPGSRHDGWTWDQEYAQLWFHEDFWRTTHALAESIRLEGIKEPILLGNDGRVWDGHHRVVIAIHLRIVDVPVKIAEGLRHGAPCEIHDICVGEPGCILYPDGDDS